MTTFRYKILDNMGTVSTETAVLPFDDETPAIRYLERQGRTVLKIRPLGRVASAINNFRLVLNKAKRKELAELFNNLSMLLSAGVPILTALNDVTEDQENKTILRVLSFVRTDIESGQTLSEAMSRHEAFFSPIVLNMCRIGEETGNLDAMLKKSSEHILNVDHIVSSTKRALLYPLFLTLVVLGAAGFWFLVVVPQLVGLFKDMNVELPFLTQLLIIISDIFQACFFYVLGAGIFFAGMLLVLRKKSTRVRYAVDAMLLRVPVVKGIIETSMVAQISEKLGILLTAGIGVLRTLEIITDTTPNMVCKKRMRQVREGVTLGNTISTSMRQANAMHPFAIRMLAVGEQTGKIDEQTAYIAQMYRDKISALVEVLGKTLEPAMLIFLGGIFALVIGGLLLPVYDLISAIQG